MADKVIYTAKDDPKDLIAVEIGDTKQTDFYPQVKVMRWDNEANLSLRYTGFDLDNAVISQDGNSVEYVVGDITVKMFDDPNGDNDGSTEVELTLDAKPASNVFNFTVRSKNVLAFVQPAINEQTFDDITDENLVLTETDAIGTDNFLYAHMEPRSVHAILLYNATSRDNSEDGKNYATGKFQTIYRPLATDANNATSWCEHALDLDTQTYTITVSQDFLDNATYPVKIDPTLGNTHIGANQFNTSGGVWQGGSITPTVTARVLSYSVYVSDIYNNDLSRFVLQANGGFANRLEISPVLTTDQQLAGYLTWQSTGKPYMTSGKPYALAFCAEEVDGGGLTGWYYDILGAPFQGFSRNTNTSITDYIEQFSGRYYTMFATYQNVYANGYSFRRQITIDKSIVPSDQTNYPFLFSGTYTYLKTTANGGQVETTGGWDVRFETIDGIKLDHEIESWSATTGAISAWVRIPTLSSSANTKIWVYYGNPSLKGSEENAGGVWPSDYKAVYHFGQHSDVASFIDTFTDTNGTTLTTHNTAVYRLSSTYTNNMTINASGRIGPASPGCYHMVMYDPGTPDYYMQYNFVHNSATEHVSIGIRCANVNDFKDSSYWCLWEHGSNVVTLNKYTAGGSALLGTYTTSLPVNTLHTFRIEAVGSTIRVLLDGVVRITAVDSSPLTGRFSVFDHTNSGTGDYIDDLVIGIPADASLNDSVGVNGLTNAGANFIAGKIANSANFVYSESDTMATTSTSTASNGATALTVEGWIKTSSLRENNYLINKCDDGVSVLAFGLRVGAGSPAADWSKIQGWVSGDGSTIKYATSPTALITNGVWTHLALVFNGATPLKLYQNGAEIGSYQLQDTGPASIVTSTQKLRIGYIPGWFTDGVLDELRVSTTAKSATYLALQYANQNDPSTFYSVGTEQLVTFSNGFVNRRAITVPAGKTAADLTDYPLLVSGTFDYLKHLSSGGEVQNLNGWDIRFENQAGTKLSHEIEKYVPTTGEMVAHIKIPTLATATDTLIYMYYGKPNLLVTEAAPTAVWASRYDLVQHLEETGNTTAGGYTDSTSNARNGTGVAMVAGDKVAALIGDGSNFNGTTKYIKFGDILDKNANQAFSVQVAFKLNDLTHHNMMVVKQDTSVFTGWTVWHDNTVGNRLAFVLEKNATNHIYVRATGTTLATGTTYYATLVYNGDADANNVKIYINGATASTLSVINNTLLVTDVCNTAAELNFGTRNNVTPSLMTNGWLDEVRIVNNAVSVEQATAEYANYSSPSTFYTIGTVQTAIGLYVPGNYSYRQDVTIDKTKVVATQTDMQVWFDSTLTPLKSVANGGFVYYNDGRDIIFSATTLADGSGKLNFEVTAYDPTTGRWRGWIKVPSVSSVTNTVIYILYGNADVLQSQENRRSVWGGVWANVFHFDELPTLNSGSAYDSGRLVAVKGGNTLATEIPVFATGKLYNALDFRNSPTKLLKYMTPFDNNTPTPFTVLAWVFPTVSNATGAIYAKGRTVGGGGTDYHYFALANGNMQIITNNGGSTSLGVTKVLPNVWTHLAFTLDSSGNYKSYINGVLDINVSGKPTSWSTDGGNAPTLGARGDLTGAFNGYLDEVRITFGALAQSQIQTIYNNQTDTSTFYNTGGATPTLGGWSVFGDEGMVS